jgi:protein-L-isoaspartate(D-aspartate) O-methyltransferase
MKALIIIGLLTLLANSTGNIQSDLYKSQRNKMVSNQIEYRGIDHEHTLNAMRVVPRHLFVPADMKENAYQDRPLPIGYGQTISQPYIVAYMTSIIDPKPNFKILEIGSGSGYQAAVLSEIVDSVFTIEIVPELYQIASARLSDLEYDNIEVKYGDGFYGWEEHEPFDAIVVTAAAEYIPPPLIAQLKNGGKMIIPVGSPFMVQSLILVNKKNDKVTTTNLMAVRFVPFTREE